MDRFGYEKIPESKGQKVYRLQNVLTLDQAFKRMYLCFEAKVGIPF